MPISKNKMFVAIFSLCAGLAGIAAQAAVTPKVVTPVLPPILIPPPTRNTLNVQGKLTDSSGNPLSGSGMVVTFRIYKNYSDPVGNAVWVESIAISPQNGVFNATLGYSTPLSSISFNDTYYLGMQVAGDANEMSPRQPLSASPYALGSLGNFDIYGAETVGGNIAVGGTVIATGTITSYGSVVASTMTVGGKDVGSYLVPSGAIMMFTNSCPTGWTRFAALDNVFPLGAAAYGTTGGSATNTHTHSISSDGSHSHTIPNHTHTLATTTTQACGSSTVIVSNGTNMFNGTAGISPGHCGGGGLLPEETPVTTANGAGSTSIDGAHNHGGATGSSTISIMPPYVTVVWCQKQ